MSIFLLNAHPPNQNFGDANCSTGFECNSCMKFCPMFPPRTKILESQLVQLYIEHYCCTRAVQFLNERKMGMQFYVIILILL